MIELESPLTDDPFEDALEEARLLIAPGAPVERAWPALAAAGFFAVCAFIFLFAVILSPGPQLTHISAVQGPL